VSDDRESNLVLPTRDHLVAETFARFESNKIRSQVLDLDAVTLNALGLMLTDPKVTDQDACSWLNKELGGTEDVPVVNYKAVNRFANVFRRYYQQVRTEYVRRIARLSVDQITDSNIKEMTTLGRSLLVGRVAERLLDGGDSVDSGELLKLAMVVRDAEKNLHETRDLQLKVEAGERREKKLVSDLENADIWRAQVQAKLQRIPERIRELEKQISSSIEAQASGRNVSPQIYESIRNELVALAGVVESITPSTPAIQEVK
jgi:hypothetical protein